MPVSRHSRPALLFCDRLQGQLEHPRPRLCADLAPLEFRHSWGFGQPFNRKQPGEHYLCCDEIASARARAPHLAALQGPVTNQFGAHGVIRESDLGAKRAEFQAWAIETQNVDIEILGKVRLLTGVEFGHWSWSNLGSG